MKPELMEIKISVPRKLVTNFDKMLLVIRRDTKIRITRSQLITHMMIHFAKHLMKQKNDKMVDIFAQVSKSLDNESSLEVEPDS